MRARKVGLSFLVAVLALASVEGGHRLWLRSKGTPYTAAGAREEVAALRDAAQNYEPRDRDAAGRRAFQRYAGPDVLHPFTAYDRPDGRERLAGDLTSQRRRPDEVRILIVGGSVAATFADLGAARLGELLAADARFAGRAVHLLGYARAAFKQPQQLMQVAHVLGLGLAPEAVIAIDGFNEVAIGSYNHARGSHPVHPSHDKWLTLAARTAADPEGILRLARLRALGEELSRAADAREGSAFLWSSILGRAALARLRGMRAELAREQSAHLEHLRRGGIAPHLLGPSFEGDRDAALALLSRHWAESSLSIRALCVARGIPYLHVLQPALHDEGSKPLTPDELAGAEVDESWSFGVRAGYPLLRAAGEELRARGVEFLDASRVFAGVEERIFRDACHFGERGCELLAEAIAPRLLELLAPD